LQKFLNESFCVRLQTNIAQRLPDAYEEEMLAFQKYWYRSLGHLMKRSIQATMIVTVNCAGNHVFFIMFHATAVLSAIVHTYSCF
jgi:hypothetical protein